MKRPLVLAFAFIVALAIAAGVVWMRNLRDEAPVDRSDSAQHPTAQMVATGKYLAQAGGCAGCHTARGGASMAGGVGIETPFGIVYAGNLTPDAETGLGTWSADDFWRALHNGRSKDGRLLYPAFPYADYTRVTRADADALFAYLRTLPPVRQPNRAHALRFPYDRQVSLAVWRALFFDPGVVPDEASRPADWNRGRYLVRGLGHCDACHAARNAWGATRDAESFGGGLIPIQNWYAPSLESPREASVAGWSVDDVVALLGTGTTARATVSGPMADVVFASTQHLSDADLRAMAAYLRSLPERTSSPRASTPVDDATLARGAQRYGEHCADCHGERGEGAAGAYPALAGNRAVTLDPPANVVRIVREGGFAPSTAGNPRPWGMPPFLHVLSDDDVAAVATYVRRSWGNDGSAVTLRDVERYR